MFTKTDIFCLVLDGILLLLLFVILWGILVEFAMWRFRKRWALVEDEVDIAEEEDDIKHLEDKFGTES